MSACVIQLHPDDNVAIALDEIAQGQVLPHLGLKASAPVPRGHKIAIRPIGDGEPIRRYGQIIGFAATTIGAGDHVHVHNCLVRRFAREHAFGADVRPTLYAPDPATFSGIVRADGRVATRNYIGVISSVNCSATVSRTISDAFRPNPFNGHHPLADYPNVDGVVALTHRTGCGLGSRGEAIDSLRRTLSGYAGHPNFSSVLLVGLGCETSQISDVLASAALREGDDLQVLTIQDQGGTAKTVQAGVRRVQALLPMADRVQRRRVPLSNLTVGLQCGGSDGYSGITANPALGAAADLVVRHGGTVILSETPEIYGAEHLLTRRAVSSEVGRKMVDLIEWWEQHTARTGGKMDNNPSHGNKAGGITTILEKSLGAIAKSGTTNMIDVYRYAERVTARGFVFMDSPGFDPVSATGQVAGGANMICFTTGRGSVYGCKPAPSVKLTTTTSLYRRMFDDMDVDCGGIADGTESVHDCGQRVFDLIVETASGKKTKSEVLGIGEDEFAPWEIEATM